MIVTENKPQSGYSISGFRNKQEERSQARGTGRMENTSSYKGVNCFTTNSFCVFTGTQTSEGVLTIIKT